jgi:predicted nucleic acid-binding protein
MKRVFVDAFYFLAYLNPNDSAHERACEITNELQATFVTTEWVLVEVANAMSSPANRGKAAEFIRALRSDPQVTDIGYEQSVADAGFAMYAARPDKGWSLTDCISFVVMQREGLTDALTADRHFEQAGFVALLK